MSCCGFRPRASATQNPPRSRERRVHRHGAAVGRPRGVERVGQPGRFAAGGEVHRPHIRLGEEAEDVAGLEPFARPAAAHEEDHLPVRRPAWQDVVAIASRDRRRLERVHALAVELPDAPGVAYEEDLAAVGRPRGHGLQFLGEGHLDESPGTRVRPGAPRRVDGGAQHGAGLGSRDGPLCRLLLEAAPHEADDVRRQAGRKRRPVGVASKRGGDRVRVGRPAECAPSRQHLEEDAPERPEVGALVGRKPARLLGAEIAGRSEDRAGAGEPRLPRGERFGGGSSRVGLHHVGDAEVEHLHAAVGGDLDVLGLQVAVGDPLRVGRLERPGDLDSEAQRPLGGERAARQHVAERLALDQLEHREADAVGLFEPEDRRDVRVAERREEPGFPLEAIGPRRARQPRVDDLQRHLAPEPLVSRPHDLAHPARRQVRENGVRPQPRAGPQRAMRSVCQGVPPRA